MNPLEQRQVKTLKVSGEGMISVAPNQANITLGATTENKSLQKAQEENSFIISNVLNTLTNFGIPKENIQTVTYQIDPVYDYKDGIQVFRGYRVTHQLKIKVENTELTGQIVDLAVSQGANTVSNIEFTVSHLEAYYNEALKIALFNAYTKALSLTSQLHVTLNPIPYNIEEFRNSSVFPTPFGQPLMAKATATPIQPGEITITATIISSYYYC